MAGGQPALLEAHLPRLIAQGAAIVPLAKVRCLVAAISHHIAECRLSTVDVVVSWYRTTAGAAAGAATQ